MNSRIIIAMHKPYQVPKDALYLPLQVGAEGKPEIPMVARDNTGDNISLKNATFCELTGLYWAWKNLDADAIGLAHYRRHFAGLSEKIHKKNKWASILTKKEADAWLEQFDIILPKKRNYYIETLYSHYAHTLDGMHLDLAQDVIFELCPQYLKACDKVYRSKSGYMFNMFLMKKEYVDAYCSWLFPILFELEKRLEKKVKVSEMSSFDARLYGRVSEILFNVWLVYIMENGLDAENGSVAKKDVWMMELPTMHMEDINWFKKGSAFLQAKFFGKKYKESF